MVFILRGSCSFVDVINLLLVVKDVAIDVLDWDLYNGDVCQGDAQTGLCCC